jgi:hypothetical protein
MVYKTVSEAIGKTDDADFQIRADFFFWKPMLQKKNPLESENPHHPFSH